MLVEDDAFQYFRVHGNTNLFDMMNRLYGFLFSISNRFIAKPFNILNKWNDFSQQGKGQNLLKKPKPDHLGGRAL